MIFSMQFIFINIFIRLNNYLIIIIKNNNYIFIIYFYYKIYKNIYSDMRKNAQKKFFASSDMRKKMHVFQLAQKIFFCAYRGFYSNIYIIFKL